MRRKLQCQTVEVKGNTEKLQFEDYCNLNSSRTGQLAEAMAIEGMGNTVF